MNQNVLLIIVDCLRYDYVVAEKMPFLARFGDENTTYTNYWATSHCTDPCITHILSGKHPDELRMYSMMFEDQCYTIPNDVRMLAEDARKAGYHTMMVGNDGRWYKRGNDLYLYSRGMDDADAVMEACLMMSRASRTPWFMVVHLVGMHTHYMGGSYEMAATMEDMLVGALVVAAGEDAAIFITADHGEGLGDKGIIEHGFGLWDFLTHVPLVVRWIAREQDAPGIERGTSDVLLDHGSLYLMLRAAMGIEERLWSRELVFQVGDTPPNIRHRGVVYPDGSQFIRRVDGDDCEIIYVPNDPDVWADRHPDQILWEHCRKHDINYAEEMMEPEVEKRLRGLGYFG